MLSILLMYTKSNKVHKSGTFIENLPKNRSEINNFLSDLPQKFPCRKRLPSSIETAFFEFGFCVTAPGFNVKTFHSTSHFQKETEDIFLRLLILP